MPKSPAYVVILIIKSKSSSVGVRPRPRRRVPSAPVLPLSERGGESVREGKPKPTYPPTRVPHSHPVSTLR